MRYDFQMSLEYLNNVIIGCWQLSEGHSDAAQSVSLKTLESYYEAGFRVFDCADIYSGVETLIGSFIRAHGLSGNIKVHTKYVPDYASLATLKPEQTEAIIDRSRERLRLDRLDLVQFHWWDYGISGYLEALETLAALRKKGKIKKIGLTNFDAEHLAKILNHGVPVAAMQTQYSVIDRRPEARLESLALDKNVSLLCYGTVAGGLLSKRWLGVSEPQEPFENRSLVKYILMVEEMGGWDALQTLLETLNEIAKDRDCDIATVASAYCLSKEAVRACIVGVRHTGHIEEHVKLRDLELSAVELNKLESVRASLKAIPGTVYELERDKTGKHGRIMKYDLNEDNV